MIYIFGKEEKLNIFYREESLTEEQKLKASLVIENIPIPEAREGYEAVLFLNDVTKELSYIYNEVFIDPNAKLKIAVSQGLLTPEQYRRITGIPYVA